MKKRNYLAILLCAIMSFSAVFAADVLLPQNAVVAYAAGVSAPKATASNSSYKSIKLKWKKVKGAKKYIISRSSKQKSGYKVIKTIKKNSTVSFTDKKVSCGKTYYYKITAVGSKGKKTSKAVKIKCTPAAPSKFTAYSPSCGAVTVKYGKVSGAKGYEISFAKSKNSKYKKLVTTKSASYTYKPGIGATGYYKVRAYRTVKGKKVYSPYSKAVKVTAYSHSYVANKLEPTCAVGGYTVYACLYCSSSYTAEVVPATGVHSYGGYAVEVSPTCATDGLKYTVCTACGDKHYEVMPATGEHKYSLDESVDATCVLDGKIVKSCALCGRVVTTVVPAKGHNFKENEVLPTCTDEGYKIDQCSQCGLVDKSTKRDVIPAKGHSLEEKTIAPTCTTEGFTAQICKTCGYVDEASKTNIIAVTGHEYQSKTVSPTCTDEGYTADVCAVCGYVNEETKADIIPALSEDLTHSLPAEWSSDEKGYRIYHCPVCDTDVVDTTCYINLNTGEISVPSVAERSITTSGNEKIDLNYDGISDYEITGSAENIGIDINVPQDGCTVKLAGALISNADLDCLNIKNKSADPLVVPSVSISAKVDTVNKLITTVGGNAVDSECELELKGRGTIVANTVATSISCGAKIEIKNLTLDITSSTKRGIDTELEILDASGIPIDAEFYNIEIGGNAMITINSADDGIRCKNFETKVLAADENDSVINVASINGDGIQLEGKGTNRVPLTLHSGTLSVKGGKSQINNKSNVTPIIDGSAKLNLL